MIRYDRLWITMQSAGMTQYRLIKQYNFSAGQIGRLKKNMHVSTHTLDTLCSILNCDISDIIEYIPEGLPASDFSSEAVSAGAIPPEAFPAGAVLPGMISTEATPVGVMPPEASASKQKKSESSKTDKSKKTGKSKKSDKKASKEGKEGKEGKKGKDSKKNK